MRRPRSVLVPLVALGLIGFAVVPAHGSVSLVSAFREIGISGPAQNTTAFGPWSANEIFGFNLFGQQYRRASQGSVIEADQFHYQGGASTTRAGGAYSLFRVIFDVTAPQYIAFSAVTSPSFPTNFGNLSVSLVGPGGTVFSAPFLGFQNGGSFAYTGTLDPGQYTMRLETTIGAPSSGSGTQNSVVRVILPAPSVASLAGLGMLVAGRRRR